MSTIDQKKKYLSPINDFINFKSKYPYGLIAKALASGQAILILKKLINSTWLKVVS